MSPLHFLPHNNLILQAILALCLSLSFPFFKIPIFFLQGLHTYIHPDDVSHAGNGPRAAIRRPGADPEPKPRKKSKDRFEFDESQAQIFRLRLTDGHLQTRLFFNQFQTAFNSTTIALTCLWVHNFLSGLRLCSKLGLILLLILGLKSLDGFGRFMVAALMGCIVGFLFMPAGRSARAFWLGTDQIRCNLSMIYCGWFARMLLYANYLLVVFTSLLWIKPFADLLVNKNADVRRESVSIGNADELVGNLGMSKSDFDKFRIWCLLASGLLQIVTLRSNLQMYLNEAVLSWYQRLHASKVPDLDFSRAKVFLHNHYLCLVVLQFFGPPALVLIFLGFSQIDEKLLTNFQPVCSLLPCSALVKEIALFMAWWITFIWAIFTSASLVLYRRGILYVS
ncbi:hypothetical protein Acr_24g0015040 [Actinidia rufa]|uniref:Transmembrane protein n=1 Tax=Actinidia rufa TaxID=165716 RepID=A0A7J0GXL9_9ERIC|nr:hypothetical protein Acr_24g0015040 [Actinidia rufa]